VSPLSIRPAQKDDISAILALYYEINASNDQPLTLSVAESIFQRMQQYPDYKVYIGIIEDKVIATFALLIMDNLAHNGAPSGIVEDVVMHPRYQNQCIGKRMMQQAMAICKEAKCYKMVFSSNAQRKRAHEFYRKLGFEQHGYSFMVRTD
jgi:GNAT superfamily N-acetyltransferase